MSRTSLKLAALATAAISGLDAQSTREVPASGGYDIAVVTDGDGHEWAVRSPRSVAAGVALEAEAELLEQLQMYEASGVLPFTVPRITGSASLPEGGRAVVHQVISGHPLNIGALKPGPGLAADVGRCIAAIHELPRPLVENAGLPVYEPDEYRERRMAEVDEAAHTGKVPAPLLRRWEAALEDVSMWRFSPVVVHGDLGPEQVLTVGDRVVGITDWSEARVADPADDLAWLLVSAPPDAIESIVEAYQLRRTELRDPFLTERAFLVGELALAKWLLHGVRSGLPEVIDDAVGMLQDLAEATSTDEEEDEPHKG